MKKRMIMIGILVIAISVALMVYITFPRTIDVSLTGVKYQLGVAGKKADIEPATVRMQGHVYIKLNGQRTFKGEVNIVGEQIPVPLDQRKVVIPFADDGWGSISYPYFLYDERGATKSSKTYISHSIFVNKDFTQVSLLVRDPNVPSDSNGSHHIWSLESGLMFSAPATTREEALSISNKLMSEFLKNYGALQ